MNVLKFISKYISRKLIVLAIATYLVFNTKISGDIWLWVALAYLGTNVLDKVVNAKFGGTNESSKG